LDEGYIEEEYYKKMKINVVECIAILNGYIKYLINANRTQ
jgi:hypothetical protein